MDPRYPIGKFEYNGPLNPEQRRTCIAQIAETPQRMRAAVAGLGEDQLQTPYRDGGWTVRQLVHHVADSHMNAYMRFKLALTEDCPTIKPYNEAEWAKLPDSALTPLETSLRLLEGVHERWLHVLGSLKEQDFSRKLNHPEMGILELDKLLALYAWHGQHHVAHVTTLRERMGWKQATATSK